MSIKAISIEPNDYDLVIQILKNTLTGQYQVYAFGSRVKSSSRKYSDLDLLIFTQNENDIDILRNRFDDSRLGFSVDVISRQSMSDEFFACIESYMVLLLNTSKLDIPISQ